MEKTAKLVVAETEEDVEDPVETMLKKTGCLEKHYSVADCIAETKDWRKCQKVVAEFRQCMDEHQKSKNKDSVKV